MGGDQNPNPRPALPLLSGFTQRCPGCDVAAGEAHECNDHDYGCDVARCLVTGHQRLTCTLDHHCGHDIWTGWYPGLTDCERLGWMIEPGVPDLDRLHAAATWDPERCLWTARA